MGGGSFAVNEGQRQTSTLLLLLNLICVCPCQCQLQNADTFGFISEGAVIGNELHCPNRRQGTDDTALFATPTVCLKYVWYSHAK